MESDKQEKINKSKRVLPTESLIVSIQCDMTVHLEERKLKNLDGTEFTLNLITPHTGKGIVIVPHFNYRGLNYVACVEQWREALQRRTLEFPRGTVNEFNDAEAARELEEETGLVANSFRLMGTIYPDTGLLTTKVDVYGAALDSRQVDTNYTFVNKYENDIEVYIYSTGVVGSRLLKSGCSMSLAALYVAESTTLFNLNG